MRQHLGTSEQPRVSFLLPTFNRRDVVLSTLDRIQACGLPPNDFEVLVIDNASTDGTADAICARFPSVTLVRQSVNLGPCAKNVGLPAARGEFVVFLDDDSFPQPGAIARMLNRFRTDPRLGAAVFTITLPDGSQECSAYPNVCIGCGTGFRRQALLEVGGLPEDFFMAAEEYDLSLRLLDAGWNVRSFDDLHVTHLKSPVSRFPARIARLDARNNALLAMRYFPEPWRMLYAMEWLDRYRLMAMANDHRAAFWAGAVSGLARGLAAEYRPIRAEAFEQFARIEQTYQRLHQIVFRERLRRVLFIDFGKNIPAYRLAAERCGLEVVAIADSRLGGRALRYRGVPIVTDGHGLSLSFDAAVISNLSPVHARERLIAYRRYTSRRVIDLFETVQRSGPTGEACITSRAAA
jgi:hypothetical protein